MDIIELFAGVGGFRLGFEKSSPSYRVIFSNQWEPSSKHQYASEIYVKNFGNEGHLNKDITQVPTSEIPDADILCAGFPCQDYSVAKPKNLSKGIEGNKGVLWWEIYRILYEKEKKPMYLVFENVDRLLISPSFQKGRDFSIILFTLQSLGYNIEWRVVNAADYGFPQKRKRVFLIAYQHKKLLNILEKAFPSFSQPTTKERTFYLYSDIQDSKHFSFHFENSGSYVNGIGNTCSVLPCYSGPFLYLRDCLEQNVDSTYYVDEQDLHRWRYLKGAKNELRKKKNGIEYVYREGAMVFPDKLDAPSRTIITSEGGKSPSRTKHIIGINEKYRRITPIEVERLNGFPDNFTQGIPEKYRYFLMGNALVVGVVEKIATALQECHNSLVSTV